MFPASSQKKCWMFPDEDSIREKKTTAHRDYCKTHGQAMTEEQKAEHFLSMEESEVIVRYFEKKLIEFCVGFKPPMPKGVQVSRLRNRAFQIAFQPLLCSVSGHSLPVFQAVLPQQHRDGLPPKRDPSHGHLLGLQSRGVQRLH